MTISKKKLKEAIIISTREIEKQFLESDPPLEDPIAERLRTVLSDPGMGEFRTRQRWAKLFSALIDKPIPIRTGAIMSYLPLSAVVCIANTNGHNYDHNVPILVDDASGGSAASGLRVSDSGQIDRGNNLPDNTLGVRPATLDEIDALVESIKPSRLEPFLKQYIAFLGE